MRLRRKESIAQALERAQAQSPPAPARQATLELRVSTVELELKATPAITLELKAGT